MTLYSLRCSFLLLCSYLTDRKEPFQQGISNLRRHRLLRIVGGLVACCPGLRFIGSLRIQVRFRGWLRKSLSSV
jgi:hypothetical protein